MKPQLGDTILNRYTLVSSLREEPGIQAWKANDRVLAKDCQLFIITDRSAFAAIDKLAGRIAATRPDRVIPILKYRMESDVLLIVMPVDSGQCLTDYMVDTAKPLSYSAIRSIIGECADVLREVIADTPSGIVITTDTVRVTTSGVQIADAPCATMLADTSATDLRTDGPEPSDTHIQSACLAARHPWRIPRDLQAWIGLERARRSYVANGCPCRTRRLVG